jgi:hypothetical protein
MASIGARNKQAAFNRQTKKIRKKVSMNHGDALTIYDGTRLIVMDTHL